MEVLIKTSYFLYAVLLLGVLIFVHELGHFLVAKLLKVKVVRFSLGFGRKIIGRQIGETEYLISAIPLGGYVKMVGEDPEEGVEDEDKDMAFSSKPVWVRICIAVAGPLSNLLLAYFIFAGILLGKMPVNIPKLESLAPVIDGVVENSPAMRAGLNQGDVILSIEGESISIWNEMTKIVSENPGKELTVKVKRNGQVITTVVTPAEETAEDDSGKKIQVGRVGVYKSSFKFTERSLEELKAEGVPAPIVQKLGALTNQTFQGKDSLEERLNQLIGSEAAGKYKETILENAFRYYNFHVVNSNRLIDIPYDGLVAIGHWSYFILESIYKLFTLEISSKNIGGPIAIVEQTSKAASSGLLPYLIFMAIISINLGILNLLPIPLLDGSHILFFCIEGIRKKPLSLKMQLIFQKIGIVLLASLMLLATYNDITRLLGRFF
ncbi:MAG TPA: site-2 protease family protein [Thermodesulfovibrionia bacterium]|nr:site-2 protease family protein [Thermodesulfovibrionia bacterium]